VRERVLVSALVVLALLGTACGQKSGVAGSFTGSGSEQSAGDTGELDGTAAGSTGSGGGAGTGTAGGGTGRTGGGRTAAGGGGGSAAGGTTGGGGGGTAAGGTTGGGSSGAADRTGITSTTIKIGIHAPKTGAAAVSTFDQAVGVYSQWAGKISGLGGRRLEVVSRDDRFDPAAARSVCKELVEKEKVFVLIGGAGVDAIKSCAEYAASKGVPYFSPGVTEAPFRSLSNYFALSETYSQQNVQVAQLIAHQVKKKKVGMVLTDSPLLNETDASFRAEAKKNGLTVVGKTQRLSHDAGKTQTDTVVSNLKGAGAEVVYALISPTVFGFLVSSAKQQTFYPTFTGPGLSNGVNLIANAICPPPPFPDVRYLSPMVQMDVINSRDANYQPAYRQKNPGRQPDDIGILLWGIEKAVRLMLESDGPTPSRQSLMKKLSAGKPYATNVYAPMQYGGLPHFGVKQTTLLTLDCSELQYKTTKAFASSL
jgi:branched-chain amino acid transport system substrate-binding protein